MLHWHFEGAEVGSRTQNTVRIFSYYWLHLIKEDVAASITRKQGAKWHIVHMGLSITDAGRCSGGPIQIRFEIVTHHMYEKI